MTWGDWLQNGGSMAAAAAALKMWLDLRAIKREEKADEKQRYDALWERLNALSKDAEIDRDEYRAKLEESEQRRVHEGEACEKRIRESRREAQAEADELREQVRKLSRLCHSQQLEIDSSKNEVSSLKARIAAADITIAGGRRAGDPPA